METSNDKFKWCKKHILISYTALFLLFAGTVAVWFFVLGKITLSSIDGFSQHYPWLAKMHQLLADLLHGNGFPSWLWDAGLGIDTVAVLGNYLFDPIAWVMASFPLRYLDVVYTVGCFVYLYLGGATMLCFLQYCKIPKLRSVVGALSYAFCAWATDVLVFQSFFLTAFIFFPLLMLGVEKVAREKKGTLIVVATFLSLVFSTYFSYMSGVMVGVYVIVRYFVGETKRTNFVRYIFTYLKYVFVAVLLSAPVVLVQINLIMSVSADTTVGIHWTYGVAEVIEWLVSLVSKSVVTDNHAMATTSALMFVMLPAVILRWKKHKKQSILFGITFLMLCLPICRTMMNGFTYSTGRWAYCLAFFQIWACVSCFDLKGFKEKEYRKKYIKALIILGAGMLLMALVGSLLLNVLSRSVIMYVLLNIVAVAALYVLYKKNKSRYQFCLGTVLVLFLFFVASNAMEYAPIMRNSLEYKTEYSPYLTKVEQPKMAKGKTYSLYQSSLLKSMKAVDTPPFYRVEMDEKVGYQGYQSIQRGLGNESLYWNVPTTGAYSSGIDEDWMNYNKAINNQVALTKRVYVWSNDNRSRSAFLQGTQYYLKREQKKDKLTYIPQDFTFKTKEKGVDVYESIIPTSIGYVYSKVIKQSELMKLSYLQREQAMLQAACVPDSYKGNASAVTNKDLTLKSEKLSYQLVNKNKSVTVDSNKKQITVRRDGKQIRLNLISAPVDGELYVEIKGLKHRGFSKETWMNLMKTQDPDRFNQKRLKYYQNKLFTDIEEESVINAYYCNKRKMLYNPGSQAQAISGRDTYTLSMGRTDATNRNIWLTFVNSGVYTYDEINVWVVPDEGAIEQKQALSDNRMIVTKKTGNSLIGKINSEKDGILYISIPYTKAWTVKVDGVKQDTFAANVGFLGVNVPAGSHDIVMMYVPAGLIVGLMMAGAGVILIVIYYLWKRMKRHKSM